MQGAKSVDTKRANTLVLHVDIVKKYICSSYLSFSLVDEFVWIFKELESELYIGLSVLSALNT